MPYFCIKLNCFAEINNTGNFEISFFAKIPKTGWPDCRIGREQ